MSSISIVSSVAEFVIENRWSGTLPYIMLTPAETPIIFIFLGMLPLLGLSALIASLTLIAKEESNIGQIIPFLLLVSGVYYSLEVLPSIPQFEAELCP